MLLGVVGFFDPMDELAVEGIEATQVQSAGKKLLTRSPKKSFDFSLRRAVPYGCVTKQAADTGADLDDFLGAIDGPVVHVKGHRDAAFVEGGAEGLDEGIDIFGEEELAVATDAAGIVQESDEARVTIQV